MAWQDTRNGNSVTNTEDIYFASIQHSLPAKAAENGDDDVPGWIIVGAAAAIGMGLTVTVALFLNRRRSGEAA